nr:hypothetical protein [Candidatus Phytoplasma sacchari]KAB8121830.1 hypothetical protein F2B49_02075 [Candidatus Phytoplasma sacchari]
MLIFLKKFYNFIISLGEHFLALSDHVEKVKVLGSFDIFVHILWIVFILFVIGCIVGFLVKFKIIFYILYFIGLVILKIVSLFRTKKLSEQEKYYLALNAGLYQKNYQKPVYRKPVSTKPKLNKFGFRNLPLEEFKNIKEYILNSQGGKRK